MYKLDLPVDLKESAAIERRRNREKERQSRIFNARVRTIGVDVQALEEQVNERKWMEDQERRRADAFASDMLRNDKIAVLLQKRQEQDIRELNRATNEFRRKFQTPDTRREFDLYDPDLKKKDKPARVSDDDPRCGVSSLQKFLGEDLNEKARKKLQQEQMREWATQQMNERNQEKANLDQANHLHELKAIENDLRAQELARAEQECRRAINIATKDLNIALANERKAKEDLDNRQEQEDNMTEIANNIHGDLLTENPLVAQSAFGPHRVVPDRWKGMSPAELNAVRITQHEQMLEKERLKEEERQRNEEWDRQRLAQARAATIMERQEQRLRNELNRQQLMENSRLATEQKIYKDYLEKEVYTNPPTAAYFMQFNTSSR